MRYIIICVVLNIFNINHLAAQDFSPIQTGPRITYDRIWLSESSTILKGANGLDSLNVQLDGSRNAFGLGMFMQFNLADYFFIRPEANIQISTQKYNLRTLISSGTGEDASTRLFSFSMPVHIGYRIEGISLQAGVVWHRQLRNDNKDAPEDFIYEFNSSHLSYSFGLGYQTNWLLVDIYYEKSFNENQDRVKWSDTSASTLNNRSSYLSLRIGFVLAGRN